MCQAHHERTSSNGPSLNESAGAYSKPHSNPSLVLYVHEAHLTSRPLLVQKPQAPHSPVGFRQQTVMNECRTIADMPVNIQPDKCFFFPAPYIICLDLGCIQDQMGSPLVEQASLRLLVPVFGRTISTSWNCGSSTSLYAILASNSAASPSW